MHKYAFVCHFITGQDQHVNMNEFWNSKKLVPPPVNFFMCKSPAIDIKNVISILDNAIDTLIIPNTLQVESAIMRRVIYRLKLQFRLDKGFKLFESTNRNLNQLFAFNITKDLMYLLDEVPKKYSKDFYFPSKQMLQYVLVRLQGYSQVCSRVVDSAVHAAILMKGRVHLGHQWEIAVVCLAICCRIWQICKHFTIKCCLLYNELLPLLNKLEIAGSEWLPDNYQFPNDLIEWLNYDWLLDKPDVILQLPLELPIFSLLDDDENDVQYNDRYKLNRSKTIVITNDNDSDSEDEYNMGQVKFVCNFNKTYVKLNDRQVNKLQPKVMVINDSDSDNTIASDCESNNISTAKSLKNIPTLTVDLDEEDADVHIIEPTENQKSSQSLNINDAVPLHKNGEVIEINDSLTEDVGEIISREIIIKDYLKPSGAPSTSKAQLYEFSNKESKSSVIKENKSMDVVEVLDNIVKEPSKRKRKKKLASQELEIKLPENGSLIIDESNNAGESVSKKRKKKLASQEEEIELTENESLNVDESNNAGGSVPKKKKKKLASQEEEKELPENQSLNVDESNNAGGSVPKKKKKKLASQEEEIEIPKNESMNIEESNNVGDNVELEDLQLYVELKGFRFKMNAPNHLNKFIARDETLRNMCPENSKYKINTKKNKCISSHLTDEDWHWLSYEMKYYVALTIYQTNNNQKAKYMRIVRERLKEVLDWDNTIRKYGLYNLLKEPAPLCVDSKIYFINSLNKIPEIQIFLKHEGDLRNRALDKCFFPEVELNNWQETCYEIKYLILLACHKPLKSIICINKIKSILRRLCGKPNKLDIDSGVDVDSDDDIDLDDDINDLKEESRENMDISSLPTSSDSTSVFDYVCETKSYPIFSRTRYKKPPMSKKEKKKFNNLKML